MRTASLFVVLFAARLASAQNLATEDDKTLYALGAQIGKSLGPFSLTAAELKIVQQGMADQVNAAKLKADPEQYREKIGQLAQKRGSLVAEKEKARGKAFLDKAAKEKGATKTASGLIYSEITPGKGPTPKPTDTVKVNYKGTLIDGTEFDSSYKRGQPAEFPLNGVIPCWTEGVQKMKVGGKSKLVCPSDIAYGDRGAPPNIPGGATLVFEVELISIGGQK